MDFHDLGRGGGGAFFPDKRAGQTTDPPPPVKNDRSLMGTRADVLLCLEANVHQYAVVVHSKWVDECVT